jgi:hypothetical protein
MQRKIRYIVPALSMRSVFQASPMRYMLPAVFALLAIAACKKVINVDLNNVTPQIVIEGNIDNTLGVQPVVVKITKTVNFSADNVFPPVRGATVIITDSTTGRSFSLNETDSGVYTTFQLSGIPKHTYILSVTAEGKQYTAKSTMPGTVGLDSVTFAENTDFNNKKEINAVVNFQDPTAAGNNYQFTEYLNGKLVPNIFVFEDRLSNGRYIEQPLFNDSAYLQKGDTLTLSMYCVDRSIYNYFFTLLNVTGDNNFQSATPANPNTNFSNGALGYFSAHTVNKTKLVVY